MAGSKQTQNTSSSMSPLVVTEADRELPDKETIKNSIYLSTAKRLGVPLDTDEFEVDVIQGINTALNVLTQLGVGPKTGFAIDGADETWTDFLGYDSRLSMAKEYVYCKTRLVFDTPTGAANEALKDRAAELEFRLNVQVDPPETFPIS